MKTALLALATLLLVTACARQERVREIDWARSALARNPAYEIVATDEAAGVFTVRDTATGTVHALKLEDLIATPRAAKSAFRSPEAAPAVEQTGDAPAIATPGALAAADQTTESAPEPEPAPTADATTLASGPGYRIERAESTPAAEPAPATIEGPGYSITRHASADVAGTAQSAPDAEAVAANADPGAERSDPIICQGERLMRIDGETLSFSGDAFIAEEGCDLYIANANIRAGGVGIIARRARVHIVNSTIDGERGSYEASDGAEMYVTRSTFNGIGRRFDKAQMKDLGGNKFGSN